MKFEDLLFEVYVMISVLAMFMTYGAVCVINDPWGALTWLMGSLFLTILIVEPITIEYHEDEEV